MAPSPLNSDGIKVGDDSIKSGFLEPFYQGAAPPRHSATAPGVGFMLALSCLWMEIPVNKKNKSESSQEDLEERVISLIASLFASCAHSWAYLALWVSRAPVFLSPDSGSGIFVWHVDSSVNKEPLNKWYEHDDWIYRGVHCLAVSGTGYLYTGSRDKTIKAWSLEDYSLRCTMTGHKSTVSCLAVASGILYSGSWDGTIRSWWLTDHSPLSVLEDNTPGSIAPVLSIATEVNFVVSSYENGCLKVSLYPVSTNMDGFDHG